MKTFKGIMCMIAAICCLGAVLFYFGSMKIIDLTIRDTYMIAFLLYLWYALMRAQHKIVNSE